MQSPDRPSDDGHIGLPSVDAAMNRVAPRVTKPEDDKGALRQKKSAGEDDDQKVIARARKRFDRCISAEADNRKATLDDLKFKTGEGQWPAAVVAERNFDSRPCITINKLPTFVNQVVNEQRMNRPAININPVGDKSDPEVAKMYRGLIRAIERQSFADTAYDTGFEAAVDGGFGYWRIMTEYESPTSFDQVIVIKRIRNRFTVYLDPAHQEPDGSDARYGFITDMIPRHEFEDEYPDADPMPWTQSGAGEQSSNWTAKDEVRIAEYFEIDVEKRRLVMLDNGHAGWFDELSDEGKQREIIEDRWADWPQTKWYKMTAVEIIDERDWPGRWIPIVKVVGNETDIEGKVKLSGLIRNAKSSQLMYNYHRTLSVELSSLQPKAPWVMEEGQIEGHESAWKQANTKPLPYLLYRGINVSGKPSPPPQRQAFQGAPQAVLAEVQAAAQDMMAVTGIRFDATLGERTYDESGRALRELRRSGDIGSFHYIDNLARSLRHTGEILVDLIPKVYDTKRILTILREDDGEEQVQLDPSAAKPMQEGRNPATGRAMKIFNPTYGRYGVTVTIGPSYATKRIEAGESMMDFVRAIAPAAPQIASGIADLIAKNQDWPGAAEFATRIAKMQPPNLMTPEMKDVPPQVQAALSNLQQQVQTLNQEKAQILHALGEQQSDRAQKQDKIDKDFEGKLLAVLSGFEAKMAGIQQKSEQHAMDSIGAPIQELAAGVNELKEAMRDPGTQEGEPPIEGARRAPDGNWYVEDPTREGKYLMVQ